MAGAFRMPAHPRAIDTVVMDIRQWPSGERPRERLLERGASTLSDAELLAIFLGSGRNGLDAVALGRQLIAQHGSLRSLLDLSPSRLAAEPGLGPASACRLKAALELATRHLGESLQRGEPLTNAERAGDYFSHRLRGFAHEVFACLFLDTRHRPIAFEELFRGTVDGAEVHPREVVKRCLNHNAAAIILGHNHPSGIAEPSAADRSVTERLRRALELIGVRLLDHFIIGDGPPVSMAERGLV